MKNFATYLMLFLGMVCFGSATPVSKIVVGHFSVFVGGAIRVLLAFLILLPFTDLRRISDFKGKNAWLLAGIGLVGVLGFTVFLLFGMDRVSGVTGSILMSTVPAITGSLSFVFFRDHFGWKKGMALALAVAGVWVLRLGSTESGSEESSLFGIVLVLAAIFCEAGYTLMGKALTRDFRPIDIAAFSALIGFLGFIPFIAADYPSVVFDSIPEKGWWSVAWYGFGTMGLGSVLWYRGVQRVEGSTAAAFMGVMPVSALILSYWLLDETFEWIHVVGFGIVFSGLVLMVLRHREM